MKPMIYHNPRCSKSRAMLQILQEKGIDPEVVHYLETPPTEDELTAIIAMLGIKPKELIRFKEDRATQLGISKTDDRPDSEWISLMVNNPILLERPIVVTNGKAAIGRPPESVLEIVD